MLNEIDISLRIGISWYQDGQAKLFTTRLFLGPPLIQVFNIQSIKPTHRLTDRVDILSSLRSVPLDFCFGRSLGDPKDHLVLRRDPQSRSQRVETNPIASRLGNGLASHVGTALATSKGVAIARRAQNGTILGTVGRLQGTCRKLHQTKINKGQTRSAPKRREQM